MPREVVAVEFEFRSAAGSGRVVLGEEPRVTVAFDDGLRLVFEEYWGGVRDEVYRRGWDTIDARVAIKELPEPDKAFYRMARLVPRPDVLVWAGIVWFTGVWVAGEVPCYLRYWGLKAVEGRGAESEGKVELKLTASPRPDGHRLAFEAFKRLYRLMTNPLEVVVEGRRYVL